jgi:hypothetical protein
MCRQRARGEVKGGFDCEDNLTCDWLKYPRSVPLTMGEMRCNARRIYCVPAECLLIRKVQMHARNARNNASQHQPCEAVTIVQ